VNDEQMTALVKFLAVEQELVFADEQDYQRAVALGVAALQAGRGAAAGDIRAEAKQYPSAVMAPVAKAFARAEFVAAYGRLSEKAPQVVQS